MITHLLRKINGVLGHTTKYSVETMSYYTHLQRKVNEHVIKKDASRVGKASRDVS